jgi:hypothetical protein
VGTTKNGRLGDFAQRLSIQNFGVANDILYGNLFQLARFAVYDSVFIIVKFHHDLIPAVIRCHPAYHIFAKRDTETIQSKKDLEVLQKILLHKVENDIIIKGGNHNVSKS